MPNEIPTIFHLEEFVEFGFEKFFTLDAKVRRTSSDMRRFSPDKRRCYFEGERKLKFFKSYTKKLCDFECITNYTLKQCGCVKFSMPRGKDTPVCDLDKIQCYTEVMRIWPFEDDAIDCMCFDACNEIEYKMSHEREVKDVVVGK
jgi:amiloride-sensitive sodium channel